MPDTLRSRIIRLAHARPDLRSHLLPIVTDRVAMEFDTQEAMDKYLKDHPKADKSKHKVKGKGRTEGESKRDVGDGSVDPSHPGLHPENPHAFGKKNPSYNPKGAKNIRSTIKYVTGLDGPLRRLEKQGERASGYKGDPQSGVKAHRKVQEVLERVIEYAAEVEEDLKHSSLNHIDDEKGRLSNALGKVRKLWQDNKDRNDKLRAIHSQGFARDVREALSPIIGIMLDLESTAEYMEAEDAGEGWYGVRSPFKKGKKASESDAAAGSDGYYMTAQYLRQIAHQAAELADAVPPGKPLPDWFEAKVAQAANTIRDLHGYMKYGGE